MSIMFNIEDEDLHPANSANMRFRYKTSPNGSTWGEWHDTYFTIGIEQPTTTGSDPVCYSGSKTFTITDVPDDVSSLSVDISSNLHLISWTSNSVTVRAKYSTSSGEGWLQPKYNMDCSHTLYCAKTEVWVGKPATPTISGLNYIYCDESNWYFLDAESVEWGDFDWTTSANLDIIGSTTGHKAEVEPDTEESGYGTVYVDVNNNCGTSSDNHSVYIICGFFMMMPNPADDYVDIIADQSKISSTELSANGGYQVNLYDTFGSLKTNKSTYNSTLRIETSKLPDGIYIVNIIYNGKTYSKELVIKH
jgi:hypothetical protein